MEEVVDLAKVGEGEFHERVIGMIRQHKEIWYGKLGEIKATRHRIYLEEGSTLHLPIPYRKGEPMRQQKKEKIEGQLWANVIEPSVFEWANPVVIEPSNDRKLRLLVDYRPLNQAAIPDSYPLPS